MLHSGPIAAVSPGPSTHGRLADIMGEARRLATDIAAVAVARPDGRDHPLVARFNGLAWRRRCLDEAFYDALSALIAALEKSLAARGGDEAAADGPSLCATLERAVALRDALDLIIDAACAEQALEEARLFMCRP